MAANEQVNIVIRAKNEATATLKGVESQLGSLTTGIIAAGAAYLTWQAGIASIKNVIKAATEEELQWKKTASALKHHGFVVKTTLPTIQRMTDLLEDQTGQADELISYGFNRLIQANNSVSKSYEIMKVAADLAAGAHMDLDAAVQILLRAQAGNTQMLSRYGIQIDETAESAIRRTSGRGDGRLHRGDKTTRDGMGTGSGVRWQTVGECARGDAQ
jgi:hypothetical protein